ncbi:zinc finger protein SNAI2-like [Dreissena polymorpha]|uniref:C2H2-type domain-containing protein n=1 Tax=Dreissena polymorpha TaxID=45954 RepID=A0A9D4IG72_DREPO|nr:zinc finger protein SNAI2-like [Dreissena polymorpha]KAH3772850.1 hypothetical protein DPMN_174197 [Dreissena polymorpha]
MNITVLGDMDRSRDLNDNHLHEDMADSNSHEKENRKVRRVQLVVPEPKRLVSPQMKPLAEETLASVSRDQERDGHSVSQGFFPYLQYSRLPWTFPFHSGYPGFQNGSVYPFPGVPGYPLSGLTDAFPRLPYDYLHHFAMGFPIPRPQLPVPPFAGIYPPSFEGVSAPFHKLDLGLSTTEKVELNEIREVSKIVTETDEKLIANTDLPSPSMSTTNAASESEIEHDHEEKSHIQKDPPYDSFKYQCSDCGKSYSTVSGLSKHKQFHCNHDKKDFACKYCDKLYVSLGALKMHIRTHTLPCKCKICGKAFSRPWLLQGHVRTHTGEKPFSCFHCMRAFADRSNLRAHLQTHSEVKKYSCKSCSKTFSRMSLLLKHEDSCMRL